MEIKRLVYFGTAPIAVPALRALHADPDSEVVAVCTQPDRPSGRKRKLTPSAVKQCAEELGLRVLDPEKVGEVREILNALQPDLTVVFAYGQYIPRSIFDLPKAGSINFHPSLLPQYRGASPIQSVLADGLRESGLSVIKVGEKMDAGDVLMQTTVEIGPEDTSISMSDRFAQMAADAVPDLLNQFRTEQVVWTPQCEDEVTECGRLSKQDGAVNWALPARVLWNRLRAYQPWPGLFFDDGEGQVIKVHAVEVEEVSGDPGTLLSTDGEGPLIACGEGALRLTRLQPPGKTAMSGDAFLNGQSWKSGKRFPLDTGDA